MLYIVPAHSVDKVIIEIRDTASLELVLKQRYDLTLVVEVGICKLIGQDIRLSVIATRQGILHNELTPFIKITVCGIKIVESTRDEVINHLLCLLYIDLIPDLGKPHHAETESAFYFSIHMQPLLRRLYSKKKK